MNIPNPGTTVAQLTVGASAAATPFWWDWLSPAYQVTAAVLGLIILVLTVKKLLKENARLDRDEKRGL
jgi:hypothetical protein